MTVAEVPHSQGRNLPAFTYSGKSYPAGFYTNVYILESFGELEDKKNGDFNVDFEVDAMFAKEHGTSHELLRHNPRAH
jgi:hypothetical protein